tara:strand:- start:6472 stop:7284 length:813 start_codon:yes stop_codon:yes gene_type:complete
MKLQILSDLHTEFYACESTVPRVCSHLLTDAEWLVIAGDLGTFGTDYGNILAAIDVFCKHYPHVLWVPGNHEYYHFSFKQFEEEMAALCKVYKNLHTGNFFSEKLYPGGPAIHSCTGWFVEKPGLPFTAWGQMMDSRLIGLESPPYQRQGVYGGRHEWVGNTFLREFHLRGEEAASWLLGSVEEGDIVVTHHLPTWLSVPEIYKTELTSYFYVNEKFEQVIHNNPSLWIHGHTHTSCDYVASETRVICNPRGYDNMDLNPRFNPHLIIEV